MRVAETMLATLRGGIQPRMALTKLPMIVSPSKARTVDEPLRSILPVARQMEAAGEILHASFFPVQPWLDIPDLGFAVLVCANGDAGVAQRAADRLAVSFSGTTARVDHRAGQPRRRPSRRGSEVRAPPSLADSGDGPSGGSAADNVAVLSALLAAGSDRAGRLSYLTLCDAEAAAACAKAGVGATLTLDAGHKVSRNDGKPVRISCRVHTISDGSFVMLGAGAQGVRLELGLTAVVSRSVMFASSCARCRRWSGTSESILHSACASKKRRWCS